MTKAAAIEAAMRYGLDLAQAVEVVDLAFADMPPSKEAMRARRYRASRRVTTHHDADTVTTHHDNHDASRREASPVYASAGASKEKPLVRLEYNLLGTVSSEVVKEDKQTTRARDALFDVFWDAYPLKKARADAAKAFAKVMKSGKVAFDDVMAGVVRLRNSGIEKQYCPHAATWLNGERWNDEQVDRGGGRGASRSSPFVAARHNIVDGSFDAAWGGAGGVGDDAAIPLRPLLVGRQS